MTPKDRKQRIEQVLASKNKMKHDDQCGATTDEVILSLQESLQDTNDERHRLEKEVEHLNKALALKLDAMPSGLSAGQSVAIEKKLAFYVEACAAHQHHIDELTSSQQMCVGAAGIGDFSEMCGWIDRIQLACKKKTELLRAVRHSMDSEKPFPSLEKITEAINL